MPKVVDQTQIFNAVIELLIKKGYAGTTTKEIAQVAGINEVTLFRRYHSKAQLVIQAVENLANHEMMGDSIQFTGDLEADLYFIIESHTSLTQKHGELFPIILSEMARYPELRDALKAPMSVMTKIEEIVIRYQDLGVLKKEEPMSFVAGLLGPLLITTMLHRANPDFPVKPINLRSHMDHYLNGYRKQG